MLKICRPVLLACLGLVCAAVVMTFAVPAQAARRVALIIGNSNYVSVGKLANPTNDAVLMARTLRGLGFTLVGGKAQVNLDKTQFSRVAQEFGKDAQGADVALFYYAGHGLQLDGTNYLVPIDANPQSEADVGFQTISTTAILNQMDSSHARLKLMILDACRNNPFAEEGMRSLQVGLAQMQAPQGTMIAFSTQPGRKALDGTNGHSPYAAALAQAMRKPGLDIFKTFNQVGIKVAEETHGLQSPWVTNSPIQGDFEFVPGPTKASEPGQVTDDETRPAGGHQQMAQRSPEDHPTSASAQPRGDHAASFKVAALPPTPEHEGVPAQPALSAVDIAQRLKSYLRDVGCDPGGDGPWNAKARQALQDFNLHAGTHLDVSTPTLAALEAVRAAHGRICPLACGRGTRREGDACVAITCKKGFFLGADGACYPVVSQPKASARSHYQRGKHGGFSGGLVMGSPEHLLLRSKCKHGDIDACRTLCSNGAHRACRKLHRMSRLGGFGWGGHHHHHMR